MIMKHVSLVLDSDEICQLKMCKKLDITIDIIVKNFHRRFTWRGRP